MASIDHLAEAEDLMAAILESQYDIATGAHDRQMKLIRAHLGFAQLEVLHEIAHAVGVVRPRESEQTCEGGC